MPEERTARVRLTLTFTLDFTLDHPDPLVSDVYPARMDAEDAVETLMRSPNLAGGYDLGVLPAGTEAEIKAEWTDGHEERGEVPYADVDGLDVEQRARALAGEIEPAGCLPWEAHEAIVEALREAQRDGARQAIEHIHEAQCGMNPEFACWVRRHVDPGDVLDHHDPGAGRDD